MAIITALYSPKAGTTATDGARVSDGSAKPTAALDRVMARGLVTYSTTPRRRYNGPGQRKLDELGPIRLRGSCGGGTPW